MNMTLGQKLYVILWLIYLSDCIWWIPHSGWFLQGGKIGKLKARFAGSLGNLQGGFVFLHLVPGWAMSFELREWPFSVSPKGWAVWVPQMFRPGGRADQNEGFQNFEDSESELRVHGACLNFSGGGCADARGKEIADKDAEWLRELKALPLAEREKEISTVWKNQVDGEAIHARVTEVIHASRWLRFMGQMQWVAMFGVTPLWCARWGLDMGILRSMGLILGLALVNTVMFLFVHRKLYPRSKGERWKSACIMLVSFPMSARGADLLTRKALLGFQAPAVVAHLCPPSLENRRLMQHWMRDVRYPLRMDLDEGPAREVAENYIAWRQDVWGKWWEKLSDSTWREEELPVVDADRKICPRCLEDFNAEISECPDCPGVTLPTKEERPHE